MKSIKQTAKLLALVIALTAAVSSCTPSGHLKTPPHPHGTPPKPPHP